VAVVIVGIVTLLLVGIVVMRIFAHQIVGLRLSSTPIRLTAMDESERTVTLEANKYSTAEGAYGARWNSSAGHLRLGPVLAQSAGPKRVVRELRRVRGGTLEPGTVLDWSGQYFEGADDLEAPFETVELMTELGPAPAWYFPPRNTATDWVVHVHGIRVTRLSPLRGVAALLDADVHSLVISYRGDTEGPDQPRRRSSLGLSEWQDIEPAIRYARDHGAERIFLMGWSMGAGMALLAAERSIQREYIDGLILVAPVTDWRTAIVHGARSAGVPGWLGRLVIAALSREIGSRLLGAGGSIDFDSLDWTAAAGRLTKPTLVLHSAGDDEIPFDLSLRFVEAQAAAELVQLPDALHTLEWNRSPEAFSTAALAWLQAQRASMD
jgi:alpha-beta hydrolase superfamily lysophospholipase